MKKYMFYESHSGIYNNNTIQVIYAQQLAQAYSATACPATASFVSHCLFSFRNCIFTKTIVRQTQTKPKQYGNPHPIPKPIFSGKVIMMTVDIMAMHTRPMPQNHVKTIIIRRNMGLTSYRLNTLLRYTTPP